MLKKKKKNDDRNNVIKSTPKIKKLSNRVQFVNHVYNFSK